MQHFAQVRCRKFQIAVEKLKIVVEFLSCRKWRDPIGMLQIKQLNYLIAHCQKPRKRKILKTVTAKVYR